jgi:hypothetical protein
VQSRVYRGFKVFRANKELKEFRARMERRVFRVSKVFRANRVLKEHKVRRAYKAL